MGLFSFFDKPKHSVAFSMDNGFLRYVSLLRTKEGIQVVSHGSEYLGGQVLSLESEIKDDALFVNTIRELIPKIDFGEGLPEANIIIPDHQAIMFHTHVTKEPARQMNDVIVDHLKTYCEAHDLLNYTEYICEYDIILETSFGYDVHVTLVPKNYANHLARLFKQAGIRIAHVETAHHAVASACLDIPRGEGLVLVSVGKEQTSIALMHADHLVSHELVPVGQNTLYATIERFLKVDRAYAKKIIERHGLLQTHPDNGLLGELHMQIGALARSVDRQLVILGQLPYKTFGERFTTRTLVVYGEGIHVKGLVPLLGELTHLTSKELDVWAGRENDRAPILAMHAGEIVTYAEALSLALIYLK